VWNRGVYKEAIRKVISERSEHKINRNEETKCENIEKVVTVVVSEVGGYEERKKRSDWYEEECQIKVEGRIKAQIKMLNRRTIMNIENYKKKK
jgi:hypothetical protein